MTAVYSMTGFATAQGTCSLGHLTIDLRCVNSRWLDLTLRIADELRPIEGAIRAKLTERVARGKLECRVALRTELNEDGVSLNETALQTLGALQNRIQKTIPNVTPLRMTDILHYPGVLSAADIDMKQLESEVLQTLENALQSFDASREREGTALAQVLLGYCDNIVKTVTEISAKMPEIIENAKRKLTERLDAALTRALTERSSLTAQEVRERISEEVTLYALKIDVDEEMNRLLTHVQEVRRVLAAGGAVGKRLDFLMQEMNREANTLGSKAAAIEMTNASLALKLTIEQMREQIQNLG